MNKKIYSNEIFEMNIKIVQTYVFIWVRLGQFLGRALQLRQSRGGQTLRLGHARGPSAVQLNIKMV